MIVLTRLSESFSEVAPPRRAMSPERAIEPDAARTARFAVLLEAYRGAYEGLAATMRRLADLR